MSAWARTITSYGPVTSSAWITPCILSSFRRRSTLCRPPSGSGCTPVPRNLGRPRGHVGKRNATVLRRRAPRGDWRGGPPRRGARTAQVDGRIDRTQVGGGPRPGGRSNKRRRTTMKGTVASWGVRAHQGAHLTAHHHSAVRVGPGDDAAVVAAPDRRVVASTDILLEGRHFRRDWSTAYDVGRKAAAQNLADIAAMGPAAPGRPGRTPGHLAVRADGRHPRRVGLADAAVVGGDVVRGDTITVAITALGDLRNHEPVTRAGAQPGDVVAVTGWLGWSAAGPRALPRLPLAARLRRGPPASGTAVPRRGPAAAARRDLDDGRQRRADRRPRAHRRGQQGTPSTSAPAPSTSPRR